MKYFLAGFCVTTLLISGIVSIFMIEHNTRGRGFYTSGEIISVGISMDKSVELSVFGSRYRVLPETLDSIDKGSEILYCLIPEWMKAVLIGSNWIVGDLAENVIIDG